tara:strand:- start:5680 stop:5928 length:249 start_codon:yes stop_codon:yes gene_type:complete
MFAEMDFVKVIDSVCRALDEASVRYALIGGFAMALRGVPRATIDSEFILMLDDLDRSDEIFAIWAILGRFVMRTYPTTPQII